MTANRSGHTPDPGEITELFNFIDKYHPLDITLETVLFPFLPEYIPAIGDIDAFIKIPMPNSDGDEGVLGLEILDEPATEQSNPTGISIYYLAFLMISVGIAI